MPSPTLPSLLRDDFVATIKAIVPEETQHSSKAWRFTRSGADIPGSEVRTFTLRLKPRGDGVIVGCGNDYQFDLQVITSYAGMQTFDADPLIVEDNRQLHQTLALRAGPLAGLQAVLWDGPFEFESEDDGKIWGFHPFVVRYIASGDPYQE